MKIFPCDIRKGEAVAELLKGADVVFHVASYGMSGAAQLNVRMVEDVNIGGTQNIVDACRAHGVRALVYVSTYNVVFRGQEIVAGDESLPYVERGQHVDAYSRTKCEAEQLVLAANSERLRTCACRPAAIYGERETRHLPRIVGLVNSGLAFFAIGSERILCDWVHGENLTHGFLLAASALLSTDKGRVRNVAGEAFHIADGHPVNNFTFLADLLGAKDLFWLRVPSNLMFGLAIVIEAVHKAVGPYVPFEPFLTKAEVCKVGYTHYMRLDKPRKQLGYEPILPYEKAVAQAREYWCKRVYPSWKRNLFTLSLLLFVAVLVYLIYAAF